MLDRATRIQCRLFREALGPWLGALRQVVLALPGSLLRCLPALRLLALALPEPKVGCPAAREFLGRHWIYLRSHNRPPGFRPSLRHHPPPSPRLLTQACADQVLLNRHRITH